MSIMRSHEVLAISPQIALQHANTAMPLPEICKALMIDFTTFRMINLHACRQIFSAISTEDPG